MHIPKSSHSQTPLKYTDFEASLASGSPKFLIIFRSPGIKPRKQSRESIKLYYQKKKSRKKKNTLRKKVESIFLA